VNVWDVHSGGSKQACIRWGAYWRHLANTIESSMCGGDVVFLSDCFDDLLLLQFCTRFHLLQSLWQLLFLEDSAITGDPFRVILWRLCFAYDLDELNQSSYCHQSLFCSIQTECEVLNYTEICHHRVAMVYIGTFSVA